MSRKGVVFTWGSDKDTGALGHSQKDKDGDCPMPVPVGLSDCVDICAGANLSAAITSKGELYTWGKGPALGQGLEETSVVLKPTLVNMMKGHVVTKISFGSIHALCLCNKGDIYSWGSNRKGQLGIGTHNAQVLQPSPCRLQIEESIIMVDIQCCDQYSAAISNTGKLFTWGTSVCLGHAALNSNNKKQSLSLMEASTEYEPRRVMTNIGNEIVIQVSLGSHYMGCCCESGQVFSWGYGGHGNLGLGDRKSRLVPTAITNFSNAIDAIHKEYSQNGPVVDVIEQIILKPKAIFCTHSQMSMGGGMFPKNPGQEGPHTLLIVEETIIFEKKGSKLHRNNNNNNNNHSIDWKDDDDVKSEMKSQFKLHDVDEKKNASSYEMGKKPAASLTIDDEQFPLKNNDGSKEFIYDDSTKEEESHSHLLSAKEEEYIEENKKGTPAVPITSTAVNDRTESNHRSISSSSSNNNNAITRTVLYSFGTCHKGLCGNLQAKMLSGPYDELIPYRIGSAFRDIKEQKTTVGKSVGKSSSKSNGSGAAADGEEDDLDVCADITSHIGRGQLLGNVIGASSSSIHNLVWNDKGELYAFGCGSGGRCGVGYFVIGANPTQPRKSRMKAYMSSPHKVGCSWPPHSLAHQRALESLSLPTHLEHTMVTRASASRYHGICIADDKS